MGFGLAINDAVRIEEIKGGTYVRLTIQHADDAPGETSITFPAHQISAYISGMRAIAANLGQPLKASWDEEFLTATLNHEGIGRPVTPRRPR